MKLCKIRVERIGLIVRVLLSLALIGVLVRYIGTAEILAGLAMLRWSTLAIVVAVFASSVLIVTLRWGVILDAIGHHLRSSALVGSVFLGFFFNQFLPTAVGGDAFRVWRARQLGVPWELALYSVLIDRAGGVFAAFISAVTLLPVADSDAVNKAVGPVVAAFATVMAVGGLALYLTTHLRLLPSFGMLSRLCETLGLLARRPRAVSAVLGLSVTTQMISVVVIWLIARELNVSLQLIDAALVTFVVTLMSTLPVSFAGWGVREGTLVFLLSAYGISHGTAFTISVLFGICLTLSSVPGILAIGQLRSAQGNVRVRLGNQG